MRRTTEHSRNGDDGIRVIDTRAPRKLARLGLGLCAVVGLIVLLWRAEPDAADPEPPVPETGKTAAEPSAAPGSRVTGKPVGHPVRITPAPATAPDPADESGERELERKLANEPTYTLSPPGSPKSGMALFPPPGTDPILRGLVVPEDFPLPEGYVRHHQVTDEGLPLPAILMFHPDFDWVDENGARIEIPADRVVPPEYAPEDMPIEWLAPETGEGDSGPSF